MELHQLRYFVAVARTGSFSQAAADCHVSQPSLSQQIQKLEDELEEPLFIRMAKGSVLTLAGELLRTRAERILREVQEARNETRDAGKVLRGKLAIGAIPTIAPYLLPAVLASFSAQYPAVSLVVHEDTTAQIVHKLLTYELDLGLASLPLGSDQLEARPLFSEELLLALPPGHVLADQKCVRMSDLKSERFILMKEGHCLGAQALNFCHQSAIEPNVALRSAQIETMHALVAAGLGVSLIPAMATPACRGTSVVFRSLAAPEPSRTIVACFRKGAYLSRAAVSFLEALGSLAAAHPGASGK